MAVSLAKIDGEISRRSVSLSKPAKRRPPGTRRLTRRRSKQPAAAVRVRRLATLCAERRRSAHCLAVPVMRQSPWRSTGPAHGPAGCSTAPAWPSWRGVSPGRPRPLDTDSLPRRRKRRGTGRVRQATRGEIDRARSADSYPPRTDIRSGRRPVWPGRNRRSFPRRPCG